MATPPIMSAWVLGNFGVLVFYLILNIYLFFLPLTGKTTTAIALAKYYEAALLTVDSIVLEAISNGNTPSGLRARELCSQAAKAQLIKDGEATADGQTTAGGLSVEAVAAHAKETGSG